MISLPCRCAHRLFFDPMLCLLDGTPIDETAVAPQRRCSGTPPGALSITCCGLSLSRSIPSLGSSRRPGRATGVSSARRRASAQARRLTAAIAAPRDGSAPPPCLDTVRYPGHEYLREMDEQASTISKGLSIGGVRSRRPGRPHKRGSRSGTRALAKEPCGRPRPASRLRTI